MVALKICGVTRADDLRACRDAGVDAVGLNLWTGSRRHVTLHDAERMLSEVRREGSSPEVVLVFVDPSLSDLRTAIAALEPDAIQLHGDADPAPSAALGALLHVPWIQVIRGPVDVGCRPRVVPPPRAILLDAAVPGYGGQGAQLPWAWASAAVAELRPDPVWLAGGLHPGNAAEAIVRVRPRGVDIASGAEIENDPRQKDPAKIAALVAICQKAKG